MKEITLFDSAETAKKRTFKYKDSTSKDGEYSAKLTPENANAVKEYCRLHNLNCKHFINKIIKEKMDALEETKYDDLTKDELIDLVKRLEKKNDKH